MSEISVGNAEINMRYLGITAGVALAVVLLYHYVIIDYLPETE